MSEDSFFYKFHFESKKVDALVAMLNELPINGFEMIDHQSFNAYVSQQDNTSDFKAQLAQLKESIPFSISEKRMIIENWNASWEEDFEAVVVDDFCVVRADFHDTYSNITHEIVITPQMSFGTGHHETTRGMIQIMRKMKFEGKKVLDFGTGTGVLAILAAKMGANDILGVDIDNNAYMNCLHNCEQNKVDTIQVKQGDLSVTDEKYDVILANINRHVILETLPALSEKLSTGKPLLISGILHSDIPLLEKHLEMASFKIVEAQRLNDWMCILTKKV